MRIGILQADRVDEEPRERFGDYPAMFVDSLGPAAGDTEFEFFDVQQGRYPDRVDDYDGYLITGSRAGAYDDDPWIDDLTAFVCEARTADVKVVGICFGHQLIAQALGGRVGPAPNGWGVGVHTWTIVRPEPWMSPPLSEFRLLASHRDQVEALPPGARLLAQSEFCPIAAYVADGCMLGIQGHPEFTKAYAEFLMDRRRDQIGPAFEPGMRSLEQPIDTTAIANWIMAFLRGDAKALP